MALETFESPGNHVATFETDELTSLCPFDFGGPDFYGLTIRYEPDGVAVEARSLKEFLQSFRTEEITAERLCEEIYDTLNHAIAPTRLYVRLEQARRGGIEETIEMGDHELRRD